MGKLFRPRIHLRHKIFLIVLPLITIPLLLVGTLTYFYLRENSLRILENQMSLALRSSSTELQRELETARANLNLFANHNVVRRYISLPLEIRYRIMQPALLQLLGEYQTAFPGYMEISIYGDNGKLDSQVNKEYPNPPDLSDFHRKLVAERPKFAEKLYFEHQDEGHIDFVMARRILPGDVNGGIREDGNSFGYLIIVMRMQEFKSRLGSALDKEDGVLAVTSASGKPHLATVELTDELRTLVRKVVVTGIGHLRSIQEFDSEYLGGFYRISENLVLVGIVTHETIDRVVNPVIVAITWSVLVVSILSILLIYSRLNHVLITPLAQLKGQLDDFKSGRELTPLKPRDDEIGDLTEVFKKLVRSHQEDQERIKELSHFDLLTGLPNRQAFNTVLDKAVGLADRLGQVLAVLYVDLNTFREINDKYGVTTGDKVVKESAVRLQSCLRISDDISRQVISETGSPDRILVRSGGDEFTVVLRDIKQAHQASVVSERIIAAFSAPVKIDEHVIDVSISIGIALYPVDGLSTDMLLKSADLAMYDAKQQAGSAYRFFTHALNSSSEKRLKMEKEIRTGLENGEFKLYLQPKVSLKTGAVREFEALVRWQHPKKGLLYPKQFLSVAEDSGQINHLGLHILDEVCKAIVKLRMKVESPKISLNVSAQQLFEKNLSKALDDCLDTFRIQPEELELEFKESLLESRLNANEITHMLKSMSERGVSLTLDDFGKGTASLTFIRKQPFTKLKISTEFSRELEYNARGDEIAKALFDLAHVLDLGIVMQGIESETVLNLVKKLGADFAQGNYLQPPVPLEQLKYDFRDVVFPNNGEKSEAGTVLLTSHDKGM